MSWKDRGEKLPPRKVKESKKSNWKDRGEYLGKTVESVQQNQPQSAIGSVLDMASGIASGLDVPGAATRSAIYGAQKGGLSGAGEELGKFGNKLLEGGFRASEEAPTGKDIAAQAGLSTEERPLMPGTTWPKLSPAGVAGFAVENIADPLNLVPMEWAQRLGRPIELSLKSKGEKQTARALSKLIKASDTKVGIDPKVIGKQLFEDDMVGLIRRPTKMLERLGGEPAIESISEAGETAFKRGARGTGLIGKTSENLDNFLRKVESSSDVPTVIPRQMLGNVTMHNIQAPMMQELGGAAKDTGRLAKAQQLLDMQLKKDTYTLSELRELKKNIGKEIRSREFYKGTDESIALDKETKMALMDSIDKIIETHLDNVPVKFDGKEIGNAAQWYAVQNAKMSSYLKMKELIKDADLKKLKKDDIYSLLGKATGYGIGGMAAGELVGAPLQGAAIGGAYHGVRAAGKFMSEGAPSAMATTYKALEKSVAPTIKAAPLIQREMTQPDNRMNRSPQSIDAPIAEQLVRTPLPRDADAILANKEFVKAKIAQQAPEMYDQISELLDHNPDAVDDILPVLVNQFPALFVRDKYNRVDGKILDPAMKEKARKDVMDNEDMDIIKKTKIIHKLNKTGYFDEE